MGCAGDHGLDAQARHLRGDEQDVAHRRGDGAQRQREHHDQPQVLPALSLWLPDMLGLLE
jgi:hypothetical protein